MPIRRQLELTAMFLIGIIVGCTIAAARASQTEPVYRECKIVNGQVFSCSGTWFNGTAVVKR